MTIEELNAEISALEQKAIKVGIEADHEPSMKARQALDAESLKYCRQIKQLRQQVKELS